VRLLSIGRALPNRQVDNHSIFNAPAAFDYEAIAIDPEGVFASIRELLDASAAHATHADVQVVNGAASEGASAAEVLRRRHDELVRALERGALVVVFAYPQALITEVAGFAGVDRYFFLPAPAGLAWDAELIRWGEGSDVAVTEHAHPFARYIDAVRDDVLYRAHFDERVRGFAEAARVFARSAGGAPIGVEFRVLEGSVVFLPAPRSRGGDAGRAQATAILAATLEQLGRTPEDRPVWAGREAVPGLDEREAEVARAEEALRRSEDQRAAADAEAEPLRRVRDVLWTEGAHALLPAALRCLELLGFTAREVDDLPMLQADGTRIELEVEGSTAPVGMAPHYRLRARLDARIEREERAPRGLVVVNGERLQAPDQRSDPYAEALRVAAEATSYALLPAPDLFRAARAALAGADDDTLAAIRTRVAETDGLVELSDLLGEGA
jgi:hypothetical protein